MLFQSALEIDNSEKYKLAVRQAFVQHEDRYDDELSTHFLNIKFQNSGKCGLRNFVKLQ